MSTPVTPASGPLPPSDAPAATRARTPGWRDPRLWIGVLIVAASVVLGVRLVGGADDTVAVWAVGEDLGVGDTVAPEDLVARRVRFGDDTDLDRYLVATEELPGDLQLTRAVGAGELLPRGALGGADEVGVAQVSLRVVATDVPTSVGSGSTVDVVVSRPGSSGRGQAETVLDDVVVVEVPSLGSELGAGAEGQVVVGVPDDQADAIESTLALANEGRVSLVEVP
ncbi:flagellar protein FlgA [Nocardioides lentus]|uniref:Flagellar protein FlgA n=1 Tax=Nocardioides lentus TaxID=338077 RepID=A0ABN2PE38_9ACTN